MDASLGKLSRWMELMPGEIRKKVPIINIAIPGSHNSMSNAIAAYSPVSTDGTLMVQILNTLKPEYTYRWFKDQDYDAHQQLMSGVRYFDLRVVRVDAPPKFYFCHTFLSTPVIQPLKTIKSFLKDHKKEVVILDFQHLYDFDEQDHAILQRLIIEIFGGLMTGPADIPLRHLTLKRASDLQKRVIVVYRNHIRCERFWPCSAWPNPWPNTCDAKVLQHFLDSSLRNRGSDIGHITQMVLTPNLDFISNNVNKCMRDVAKDILKSMKRWISNQSPGVHSKKSINIVIADFINVKRNSFCKQIVQLNEKLLSEIKYIWMTNLDGFARNLVPIIYLAIPGSNNAMSYSICWKCIPAPETNFLRRIINCISGKLSVSCCRRQTINVYEQLRHGVRYFDLQICRRGGIQNTIRNFYFCCGRYCEPITEPIALIKKYLESHPHEFIILDFRKFYNMNLNDHDVVQDFLFSIFGLSIFGPRDGFLADLTLTKAMCMEKQVLIIYRDDSCWENAWPGHCWPILSAKTEHIEDLCGMLEAKLKRRQPGIGCITRYQYKQKSKRAFSPQSCAALHVFTRIKEWLPRLNAGFLTLNMPHVNIIAADFIDTCNAEFCTEVVSLNDWYISSKADKYGEETYV